LRHSVDDVIVIGDDRMMAVSASTFDLET